MVALVVSPATGTRRLDERYHTGQRFRKAGVRVQSPCSRFVIFLLLFTAILCFSPRLAYFFGLWGSMPIYRLSFLSICSSAGDEGEGESKVRGSLLCIRGFVRRKAVGDMKGRRLSTSDGRGRYGEGKGSGGGLTESCGEGTVRRRLLDMQSLDSFFSLSTTAFLHVVLFWAARITFFFAEAWSSRVGLLP